MPQDSLKSVVYRSFLTCEDPKGVAEYKTTTKSKKFSNAQNEKQKEKASNEDLQKLSCFLEVSREAERLNQVVHRPSKRIAMDLLRGALDLQESLIMLKKLQEASKYREKSRTSADVVPKDCYDELREVIRESFARQNLLPKQRLCDVDRRNSHEKMQGSNLIAKLMGLEEVPYKATVFKQMKKEKIAYQRSPLLDIDLPRPEKPLFMVEKAVKEKRRLEEIMETMQQKGILGRKFVDGYNASFLRGDVDVDGPPIVIMRPLRGRGDRDDELHHDHFNGVEHIKSRHMTRKMRGDFPPGVQLMAKEMKSKLDEGKEEKNSVRVGVRRVKKTLDCQDRLSTTKMQKKEEVTRNIDKMPRLLTPNTWKTAERKEVKPQRSDKTRDLAKLTTVKHSRNVRENNVSRSPARRKVAASLNPTVVKKNPQKGESNCKLSSALVENIQSDGNFAISNKTNVVESLVNNSEPEQNTEEMDKDSMFGTENSVNGATSSDEINHIEDGRCIPCVDSDQIKCCKSTRCLLLSSVSFLNHVEELFNFGTEAYLPATEVVHDPLLLDCSKEILERKSLHYKSMRNQWSQHLLRKAKCHLSTDQLVQDICDGIEDLKKYNRSCSGVFVVDSICAMLERDLWWKEEATGAWDWGWRKGYTAEAVDEVMHDVEELVLSEIVDDAILELCCGDFGL